jgi:phosphate uptake regulator
VVRIAQSITGFSDPLAPQTYEKIAKLSKMSNDVYEKSMEALEKLDVKMAKEAISRVPDVAKFESEIMKEVLSSHKSAKSVMEIEVITHALKRIAEYGSDIAEMAINLCVENAMQKK